MAETELQAREFFFDATLLKNSSLALARDKFRYKNYIAKFGGSRLKVGLRWDPPLPQNDPCRFISSWIESK
jgi:hypothetical protein